MSTTIFRISDGAILTILRDDATASVPDGFAARATEQADWSAPRVQEPVPVPASVTRRQLFLAVYNTLGLTRAQIRASLGTNEAALIDFDEAQTFERGHLLVAQLATQLGLTSAQVDDLFRLAATL